MCEPTAAALILSGVGTALETQDANKNAKRVQNARNAAFERGMIDQRRFADQSGAAFNENINKQGREQFDQQAAQEQEQMKQAFGQIQTQPDYQFALPGSAPKNVVMARESAMDTSDQKTARDLEGLSGLQGYQGALFNQDMSRNNFARLFGNIQDTASRQSALIPLEMEAAANNAQKAPSLFPQLLKAAGAGMGVYSSANGITSFGDKTAFGPLQQGQSWNSMVRPGLFTNLKQDFTKLRSGNLY